MIAKRKRINVIRQIPAASTGLRRWHARQKRQLLPHCLVSFIADRRFPDTKIVLPRRIVKRFEVRLYSGWNLTHVA